MNDYYVLVDYELNKIINVLNPIQDNWNNISGLRNYTDKELKNLSWAGHPNLGWLKITSPDISNFTCDEDWLDISKNNLKKIVKDKKEFALGEELSFNEKRIKADEKTKTELSLKLLTIEENNTVSWKFINEFHQVTKKDILDMLKFIVNYTQQCYDEEMRLYEEIDSILTIADFSTLDLTYKNPELSYTKN